jgi:hypothetical protein
MPVAGFRGETDFDPSATPLFPLKMNGSTRQDGNLRFPPLVRGAFETSAVRSRLITKHSQNIRLMKLTALPSLLRAGVTALGLFAAAVLGAATVGQPAPAFTLTDIKGTEHSLSDFRGKTVVLEWVNQECPFVVKFYERSGKMPQLQKAAAEEGVVWLLINSAAPGKQGDFDVEKVKAWKEKNQVAATAYFRDQDGTVGRAYGARTTPHMFVINAEGVLVYNGAIDSKRSTNAADIEGAENYLVAALAALREGRPVATPTTQPYGCSVKY